MSDRYLDYGIPALIIDPSIIDDVHFRHREAAGRGFLHGVGFELFSAQTAPASAFL